MDGIFHKTTCTFCNGPHWGKDCSGNQEMGRSQSGEESGRARGPISSGGVRSKEFNVGRDSDRDSQARAGNSASLNY